jgi:hypothetical protein
MSKIRVHSSSVWKLEEKKPLGRSKCRYGDNIKMDFKWVAIGYVSWIYVALPIVQQITVVITAIILNFP